MNAAFLKDIPAPAAMLNAARARTLELMEGLTAEQCLVPRLAIVNPPLWELGHLGWFQEYWCLRRMSSDVPGSSLLSGADALYDSARVAHDLRWDLPLPDVQATLQYLDAVKNAVDARLQRASDNTALDYFARLSALHEEMHCEAFTYTRQTLAYPQPRYSGNGAYSAISCSGDVEISGGRFQLGAVNDGSFVFNNEKWAHEVEVMPFRMARAAVTNAQFAEFVDAGGYRERHWWSREGWAWRVGEAADLPLYWRRENSKWYRRYFDREEILPDDEPVIHVNWHEAEAWCR